MEYTYHITGMQCGNCVAKITGALEGLAENVHVTLHPPQARLEAAQLPELSRLNDALAQVGSYRLEPEKQLPEAAPLSGLKTYYPLLLILSLITLASFKGAAGTHDWMLNFMAGFFIAFGFFKLLDLRGFRDAYSTYDLLAARWYHYGFVYPFLELALGFAFLFRFAVPEALVFSILLMGFSSFGVIRALSQKQQIRCACLGTALNLPMSTITLVEDLGMVAMAFFMIV